MNENKNGNWLADLSELCAGVIGLGILIAVVQWGVTRGIESWRTKDEDYRRDCVVLPICAVIFGVGLAILGLDALFHFIPYAYLNSLCGYKG
jgi:hypothetical protein